MYVHAGKCKLPLINLRKDRYLSRTQIHGLKSWYCKFLEKIAIWGQFSSCALQTEKRSQSLLTYRSANKCIGDDTKAAARQSSKNKIWQKNDFQCGGWNYFTLQCGTIITLTSPGDCTLQCGMWLWNHDSEFIKWQHPPV